MKIERKKLKLLQDISYGDTFKQNGEIYMKIYNKTTSDTCPYGVNLATGEFHGFSNFTKVEEITLNVSEA
jgi:hypothetical protein